MDEGAAAAGELDAPRWESLSIFTLITARRNAVLGMRRGWLMLCFCRSFCRECEALAGLILHSVHNRDGESAQRSGAACRFNAEWVLLTVLKVLGDVAIHWK